MSLVEMMVVVALVAMCTLWGIHSWRSYQQALTLEQHAQQLRMSLYGTQAEANHYNRSAVLWAVEGAPDAWEREPDLLIVIMRPVKSLPSLIRILSCSILPTNRWVFTDCVTRQWPDI